MHDIFVRLAEANGGYFARHELLDSGFTDDHIRQALRAKEIVKLRHGTYAPSITYAALSPEGRHCVLAHSVADRLGHAIAISHVSAAAEYGADAYGVNLDVVHLTRLDSSSGRREAGVIHHKGLIVAEKDLREIGGRLYVEPVRAVPEMCTLSPIESGMVIASSVLRLEVATKDQLLDMASRLDRWRGVQRARIACQLSDKRFESVGEVRSFHMSWRWHLPMPELQFEVFDADGRLIGRTDFAWPEFRHVGEFDGLLKYGRLNPYSDDPGRAIVKEKRREDSIRSQELGMSPDLGRSRTVSATSDHSRDQARNGTFPPAVSSQRRQYRSQLTYPGKPHRLQAYLPGRVEVCPGTVVNRGRVRAGGSGRSVRHDNVCRGVVAVVAQ